MTTPSLSLVINGLPLENPWVGMGVYTRRLIEGILRHAPDLPLHVMVAPDDLPSLEWIPRRHLRPIARSRVSRPPLARALWLANGLAARVQRDYPDAVFHSPAPLWSRVLPRRTVVTLHDAIYHHFPQYLGRWFVRRWHAHAAERYAARARLVLTDSACSARDLAELAHIPAAQVQVVYPWVDAAFAPAAARAGIGRVSARYALPPAYWLYVGGYDCRKNVEFLLRAYAAAAARRACPPLVLAGRIPTDLRQPVCDVFGAIRAGGLSERQIRLPGMIANEDLPGIYAGAALLIYPSLYEGFGLPPAEAIAAGTPVLVADASSLPEVVPRPECRFHPTEMAGLVEKLSRAAEDPAPFHCPLRPEFSEEYGIARYLALLEEVSRGR